MSRETTEGRGCVFRADASSQIGTGHVMRCIALAQAWQDAGGEAVFASASTTPALEARLARESMALAAVEAAPGTHEDALACADIAARHGAQWVVADGYFLDALYQQSIKDTGLRLLFIDDYGHARHYCADLVLNQSVQANEALYPYRSEGTRLLLGTEYVLLRHEFRQYRAWQRAIPERARNILITMGGADPGNVTLEAINAVLGLGGDIEVCAIAGGANPHIKVLRDVCAEAPVPIELAENVENMPERLAWADVAVSAAGTTSWELAFMGLPSLLVEISTDQRANCEALAEAGAALDMGASGTLDAGALRSALGGMLEDRARRAAMSEAGRRLVDGQGAVRAVTAMGETG